MSRLIDADVFKEIVGTETKVRKMVCDLIDAQPTAYDVDKVVENLEKLLELVKYEHYRCNGKTSWVNAMVGFQEGITRAIDIVRNGGKE